MVIFWRLYTSILYMRRKILKTIETTKEMTLQRLFSTFPGGFPGVGLLLLRATSAIVLMLAGLSTLTRSDTEILSTVTFALIAVASGFSLLFGFFTPVGGVLGTVCCAAAAFWLVPIDSLDSSQGRVAAVLVAVMAASLGLLGPGAFSIDSRLFGRREIVIPHFSRQENHK